MKSLLNALKINIRGDNVTLPESKNIAPIVYVILIIITGLGLGGTILAIIKKPYTVQDQINVQKKPSGISQNKNVLDTSPILKRNLFNIEGTLPDATDTVESACGAESKKSSLAFKVTGIIFGGNSKSSIALIQSTSDSKDSVYKLGDTIVGNTKITDITSNRVYIASQSCPEYFELTYPEIPKSTRSTKNKNGRSNVAYSEAGFERIDNTTNVTKQWVNDVLTNKLSTTLEEARAVPFLVGGQVKGFSLSQIVPNSVYEKLGLKNGDVVSSINGIDLNDAARAIQTLNSLRNETKIDIEILRDGQPVNLKVNIQ